MSRFYHQDTELKLLLGLLDNIDNKTVIDVGAEVGSFIKAFIDHGSDSVLAFEPHPSNVKKLHSRFKNYSFVRIFDVALGDRDAETTLHTAHDKTGNNPGSYHSLIAREDTPTIHWADELSVQLRTLDSLVAEGQVPECVGVVKIDTEGNDLAVLRGMGRLRSAVVMVEFWDDLPETVGECPYRLAEVVDCLGSRGYSNYAVVKRHAEFETIQIDSASTQPGDWGNAIFIHDSVFDRLAPVLFRGAADAHQRLLEQAAAFERECNERMTVIQRLEQEIETARRDVSENRNAAEERLQLANELQSVSKTLQGEVKTLQAIAEERSRLINHLEAEIERNAATYQQALLSAEALFEARTRIAAVDRDQAIATAEARLRVIEEQQRALAVYRFWDWRARLRRLVRARLGILYLYSPRPLVIPDRYRTIQPPTPAPTISIVTPSFNTGRYLERTIESVLDQTYPALEYVIQDGASTDETPEILERYNDALTHVESVKDHGQANAINLAFRHTTGEIMAYLNSDDLLLPGSLNYVAQYFAAHPDIDVVYGHRVIVDEYDAEIGRWVMPPHDDEVLSWVDYVPQETLFWRRDLWERSGATMDESFRFALDWDLLLRFRDAGARFYRLPRFLGGFRVHPHQKTSAEIETLGFDEMTRLRTRCHQRKVLPQEAHRRSRGYRARHLMCHYLYRLGVLRY